MKNDDVNDANVPYRRPAIIVELLGTILNEAMKPNKPIIEIIQNYYFYTLTEIIFICNAATGYESTVIDCEQRKFN